MSSLFTVPCRFVNTYSVLSKAEDKHHKNVARFVVRRQQITSGQFMNEIFIFPTRLTDLPASDVHFKSNAETTSLTIFITYLHYLGIYFRKEANSTRFTNLK